MYDALTRELAAYEKRTPRSATAHKRAEERIPLGVASNYRHYEPYPIFVKDGKGGKIHDIDGNVREWVGACGNGSAAPAGSNCRDFRVKGRGWLSVGAKEAATASDTYGADIGVNTVGFRVVRELSN